MAATKRNRTHPDDPTHEKTRAKIQTTQLVKRLEHHVLGTQDETGNAVKLDATQVAGMRILLDKSLPNLQSTELTTGDGGPLVPVINVSLAKGEQQR